MTGIYIVHSLPLIPFEKHYELVFDYVHQQYGFVSVFFLSVTVPFGKPFNRCQFAVCFPTFSLCFYASTKQKIADEKAIKRSEQEMEKINEQMEVIISCFLKNIYITELARSGCN